MNVLVVDDSELFPLHVWRYLSRSVGIGKLGWPPGAAVGAPAPRSSPDGAIQVWWARADHEWPQRIAAVLAACGYGPAATGNPPLLALLDVHGARRSQYDAEAAHRQLVDAGVDERAIWPISAYDHGRMISGKLVRPKSRETLQQLRLQVVARAGAATAPAHNERVRHVLLTGAGFERADEHGGFGFPATSALLEALDLTQQNLRMESLNRNPATPSEDFPVLRGSHWGEDPALPGKTRRLERIARSKDLDGYWDYILRAELEWMADADDEDAREEGKLAGVWRENAIREAFRKVIRAYDWGQMNQSIDASKLDWALWLTTNYTQFADRAIAVTEGRPDGLRKPWRIVSTAAEARVAVREDRAQENARYRYLFKLHGDVGHLYTMAIAGHDKEVITPLSVPIEDLSQVYAVAQRFVLNLVDDDEVDLVVWHVVGHSLHDRRLTELLGRVRKHREDKHAFILVNPKEEPLPLPDNGAAPRLLRSSLKAPDYLARLVRAGFPPVDSAGALKVWEERALLQLEG